MSTNSIPVPTADEIVALLKKTSLPTILVEGVGDVKIYRAIESLIGTRKGNVLICGGRALLLDIYTRRIEFAHVPLAFLADCDMLFFHCFPCSFRDVVWTRGVSIENDLYVGSIVEQLLEDDERIRFHNLLDEVCKWYAFEVEQFRAGHPAHNGTGIGRVLNDSRQGLSAEFLLKRNFHMPDGALIQQIRRDYQRQLGGKTLFALLAQILSARDRSPKHSKDGLVEIALKLARTPDVLVELVQRLKDQLTRQGELLRDVSLSPENNL
jgi:hypothetical protein